MDRPRETKLIYIAGPFRADSAWEVECNVRAAERWALACARAGAMPICPHTNTRFFDGVSGVSSDFWLRGTMAMLSVCDACLVVTEGAKHVNSVGTQAEMRYCQEYRIPLFYSHNFREVRGWVNA